MRKDGPQMLLHRRQVTAFCAALVGQVTPAAARFTAATIRTIASHRYGTIRAAKNLTLRVAQRLNYCHRAQTLGILEL
jgi:hypothetical protein